LFYTNTMISGVDYTSISISHSHTISM
jgi:hypothetical protein